MSEAVKSTLLKASIVMGPFTLTPILCMAKGEYGGLASHLQYDGTHTFTETFKFTPC